MHAYGMIAVGFGQGIRKSTFSLAAILGPLWAGGAGAKGALFSHYYVLFGVPCGLLLLVVVSYYSTTIVA